MQQDHGVTGQSRAFPIKIGGTDLQLRDSQLSDPMPTGRQLIDVAGGRPTDEFIILQWMKDGDIEELNIDDTVDLREAGVERFIVAKSDRTFRFEIDGRKFSWPDAKIPRDVLLTLAQQDIQKFSVWQEIKNRPDEEISPGNPANLDPKGTERFYTVIKHTTEGIQI